MPTNARPTDDRPTAARDLFAHRPGTRILVDAAIAAGTFAGTLSQLAHGGVVGPHPEVLTLDPAAVTLAAVAAVPLLLWRYSPLGVYVVTALATITLAGLGYGIDLVLGPTAALFLLAASRDRDAPWSWRTTALVVGSLVAFLTASGLARGGLPGIELLHTGLAGAGAWFAGDRTRLRREQLAELRARAVRAERDAERERLLAVAEERNRIARDLHDSAGHAISVIAVRAGAARLRHAQEPQRGVEALSAIEELARQTVGEIDQIVATLRQAPADSPNGATPHGLASVETLLTQCRAAGIPVTLDREGEPRPLGAMADQAAYRILQEALTNVARHGQGPARVTLRYHADELELAVGNPVDPVTEPRSGGGHGLVGMSERAALLGGSLEAGRADGQFRVRARIPYGGHRT
ncbi:MAG: sensor histidine kinase [Micromonosporaceae bacterium]